MNLADAGKLDGLSTATHDVVTVYGTTAAGAAVDVNFTIYIPAP